MPNKRGYVISQIFLYGFGIIIVMVIIYFGYLGINSFLDTSKEASLTKFESKFKADMETLAVKRGETKELSYSVDDYYKKFCIFDSNNIDPSNSPIILQFYPLVRNTLLSENKNIFLMGNSNSKIYSFRMDFINIDKYPYYTCVDAVSGIFSFKAKSAIINGEPGVTVVLPAKTQVNVGNKTSETVLLFSPDNLLFLQIPENTLIGDNSNGKISIEVMGRGDQSEEYDFQPNGTTFSPPITLGIRYANSISCEEADDLRFEIGEQILNAISVDCEKRFVYFKISKI